MVPDCYLLVAKNHISAAEENWIAVNATATNHTRNGGLRSTCFHLIALRSVPPRKRALEVYAKTQETIPVSKIIETLTQSKGKGSSSVAL